MEKIIVFSDLHCPYQHKDSFKFLDCIKNKLALDLSTPDHHVFCLGDEVDNGEISFHDKSPDVSYSATNELDNAVKYWSNVYDIFERMIVMDSNHSSLLFRRAKKFGIPKQALRKWESIVDAPLNYEWKFDHTHEMSNGQKLYMHHGIKTSPFLVAKEKGVSYLQGHYHSQLNMRHEVLNGTMIFGGTVGCLIDYDSYAFSYAKNNLKKPALGCVVIIDGYPHIIQMKLDERKRWVGKI